MVLLYPRGFAPAKGQWSLMGGFVGDTESADTAASRVLKQTTGLENIYLEQVGVFSQPNRDPEARVISIVYYALIRNDNYSKDLVREHAAHWWPVGKLPDLVFDHSDIVAMALHKLQLRAGMEIIGSELLPDKFTLLQLRSLYEAILQRPLDAGNFRKKILSLNTLERLSEKNTTESKKGAHYYQKKSTEQAIDFQVNINI